MAMSAYRYRTTGWVDFRRIVIAGAILFIVYVAGRASAGNWSGGSGEQPQFLQRSLGVALEKAAESHFPVSELTSAKIKPLRFCPHSAFDKPLSHKLCYEVTLSAVEGPRVPSVNEELIVTVDPESGEATAAVPEALDPPKPRS